MKTMDVQLAEWDAMTCKGLFTVDAFVSLDGKHMLPCARVEWRIVPLLSPGAPGTQVGGVLFQTAHLAGTHVLRETHYPGRFICKGRKAA